jgi:sterol 3beta-glucosyltransferase
VVIFKKEVKAMRILILTVGTRGDVQPYVAIGHGLQTKGHEVMICAPQAFQDFIESYGLGFSAMPNTILELLDSQKGRDIVENSAGISGAVRTAFKLMGQVKPMQVGIMQACWQAAQSFQPEGLVFHTKTLCGTAIAERLGIPVIMTLPLPVMEPTEDFPLLGMPPLPGCFPSSWIRHYNRESYRLVQWGLNVYRKQVQAFRQNTLNLPPHPRQRGLLQRSDGQALPFLHVYSAHVLPRPADWPANIGVTGYAFLPPRPWTPPQALQQFLDEGDAPIYIGFGSIGGKDPAATTRMILQAVQHAKVRAVIATGWGGLACDPALIPEGVHVLTEAPHGPLFEYMAAVVHHGGAGTTAAGLRAGKPTLICPFFGDQPFWGQLVHRRGVGPLPLPQKKLSVTALTQRLQQLKHHTAYQTKAQQLAEHLRQENGVGQAVAFIEKHLAQPLKQPVEKKANA